MELRELLFLKAMKGGGGGYVQATATGNPLTFNTDVSKPLKSLLIPWTPTQEEGTGDPSPSNPRSISGVSAVNMWRTGANLIDDSKRSSAGVGYSLYIGATSSDYTIYLKAGTYRFTAEMLNGASYDLYFREKNGQAVYIWAGTQNKTTATFTIPYDGLYRFNMTGANPANVGKCWVTYGENETQYSPYTGTTIPVTFPALGKNLWDEVYTDIQDSKITYKPIYVGNNAVTFSTTMPPRSETVTNLFALPGKATTGAVSITNGFSNAQTRTVTPVDGWVTIGYRKFVYNPQNYKTQIEVGSTETAYEPYTNTVYGGSLDLTTDVLTVEWGIVTLNGSEQWETYTSPTYGTTYYVINNNKKKAQQSSICDKLKNINACYGASGVGVYGVYSDHESLARWYFRAPDSSVTTLEEFTEWLEENPVQIAYQLATPYTIQLPSTVVTALVGDNVIWSDTNGENTAVYLKRG